MIDAESVEYTIFWGTIIWALILFVYGRLSSATCKFSKVKLRYS